MESDFEAEVREQPQALLALLDDGPRDMRAAPGLVDLLGDVTSVLFLGMGSSLYASYPAVYALGRHGVDAHAIDAGEYLHYLAVEPRRAGRRLPILISQSGESPEVLGIARWLRDTGVPFVVLTNAQESSLAGASPCVLPLHAGREVGPSTKSYLNTVACALLLSESIVGQPVEALVGKMRSLVGNMAASLANPPADRVALAEILARARHVDVVARGPPLSVAYQAALLLRETTGLKTTATSAGLFRHGPMHTVGRGDVVLAIVPTGTTQGKTLALMSELDRRGAATIIVAPPGGAVRPATMRSLDIPDCDESLAQIPAIVLIELLAIEVCRRLDRNPGGGVLKVTTSE